MQTALNQLTEAVKSLPNADEWADHLMRSYGITIAEEDVTPKEEFEAQLSLFDWAASQLAA